MLRKIILTAFTLTTAVCLTSCYRVPVPQGNYITPADAHMIKKGMSSSQVIGRLGNPVLTNTYLNQQLVYVYTFKKGLSRMQKKRLIVYFSHNRVTAVSFDEKPVNGQLPPPHPQ